jgi:hypothetical protein
VVAEVVGEGPRVAEQVVAVDGAVGCVDPVEEVLAAVTDGWFCERVQLGFAESVAESYVKLPRSAFLVMAR